MEHDSNCECKSCIYAREIDEAIKWFHSLTHEHHTRVAKVILALCSAGLTAQKSLLVVYKEIAK